jgi:hypothetical protein
MQDEKNNGLEKSAENLIYKAMHELRNETGMGLAECHMALLIAAFNVMKRFCLTDAMFSKMYGSTLEKLQKVFMNIKKPTHDSPRQIQ